MDLNGNLQILYVVRMDITQGRRGVAELVHLGSYLTEVVLVEWEKGGLLPLITKTNISQRCVHRVHINRDKTVFVDTVSIWST